MKDPDFIIPGAMKAGTSSLHHVLAASEQVYMPKSEVKYFDRGDFRTESVYNLDFELDTDAYLDNFSDAEEGQLIGERSTQYMFSVKAAERIYDSLPDVKLIFMLRDPVSRLYSDYKHLVRSGRALGSLKNTGERNNSIIERSLYREEIERYREYFDDDQMMFIIFEEFVENQQKVVNEVCDFLEIDRIDLEGIDTHKNPSPGFKTLNGQLLANYISEFTGIDMKWFTRLNRSQSADFPEMDEDIKESLEHLFKRENKGISELIDKEVSKYWDYMDEEVV